MGGGKYEWFFIVYLYNYVDILVTDQQIKCILFPKISWHCVLLNCVIT